MVTVRVEDVIHYLFKKIAAIADQLQTNFSQEFRKIMKAVMRPVSDMRAYEVRDFQYNFFKKLYSFLVRFRILKLLKKKRELKYRNQCR